MKKLILTLFTAFSLFLFVAAAVRADDGNGHDPGKCAGTINCPPSGAPQQQSGASGSDNQTAEDTTLILLETLITLLPK